MNTGPGSMFYMIMQRNSSCTRALTGSYVSNGAGLGTTSSCKLSGQRNCYQDIKAQLHTILYTQSTWLTNEHMVTSRCSGRMFSRIHNFVTLYTMCLLKGVCSSPSESLSADNGGGRLTLLYIAYRSNSDCWPIKQWYPSTCARTLWLPVRLFTQG